MTRHRRGEEDDLKARLTGYDYGSNSNLVLQSDQPRSKTSKEPTGEPESLKGKMKFGFGDQVHSTKPPVQNAQKANEQNKKKRVLGDDQFQENQYKPTKKTKVNSILDADEMEGIKYQPRTRETRQQYESLLHVVRQKLGDQPQSVIMSAADEVLAILKDEEIKPKEKQGLLEELLNTLTNDNLSELFKLSNAITDYTEEMINDDDEVAAVVFGEDESDEEGGAVFDVSEGIYYYYCL
jgi:pre-mRNA-splicing helicase BRR2